MHKLGEYKNGNYKVEMYKDGTKVRETSGNEFIPNFPESIDMKITNKCTKECLWCHEQSTKNGKHGDILNLEFINTLKPYTEIALGGGNVLEHPNLTRILSRLKDNKIIANMTVNQEHFEQNIQLIDSLVKKNLIKGLGVSLTNIDEGFIKKVQKYDNAVIHIINGIVTPEELVALYNKGLKVLILGYKQFGRGEQFYSDTVERRKRYLENIILDIFNNFKVISFDNLALKQLNLKDKLPKHIWNQFYMGDDGQFTMYIDTVKEEFAASSTSNKRYGLKDDIKKMFNTIRSGNYAK